MCQSLTSEKSGYRKQFRFAVLPSEPQAVGLTAMAGKSAAFRQADVKRALKGAQAAGLEVGRVEVDAAGKIVIFATSEVAESETPLEKWKRENAGTS